MSKLMVLQPQRIAPPAGPPYPGQVFYIRGTGADNIWIAVEGFTQHDALRWTGAGWVRHSYYATDPAAYTPTGFHVAGPDAVWVQNFYQISFWDGLNWAFDLTRTTGAGEVFKGLYGFGSDVWAVHTEPANPTLAIWTDHRSGLGSWTLGAMTGPVHDSLEASSGAAWDAAHVTIPTTGSEGIHLYRTIVGGSFPGGGYSADYEQEEAALAVIGMTSATQAYGFTVAGGPGHPFLAGSGGSWGVVPLPAVAGSAILFPSEVSGVSGDEWLAGYYSDGTTHWPFAGHNTGAGWTTTDLAPLLTPLDAVKAELYSIVRLPSGEVWAGGAYTTLDDPTGWYVLVLRYRAGAWAVVPVPATI